MLKSTYTPSSNRLAPLPPGWTEHKAPTGHTYYYNDATKESTYKRPGELPAAPTNPGESFSQYQAVPNLSDPNIANAWIAQYNPLPQPNGRGGQGVGQRGGFEARPRPQPIDKPRSKIAIPGHEPWVLVHTKYDRRFVYNSAKNQSYWRIPEKLKAPILELDQARIREKAAGDHKPQVKPDMTTILAKNDGQPMPNNKEAMDDSSEYEEIEVTDDEGEDGQGQGTDNHPSKRQRTEDLLDQGPVEFTEAELAAQLQAMGEDYDLDPGEYDDGNMDDWPEGAGGVDFSEEDAQALFKDLLNDFNINPYSPWEKLIEEGKVFDDPRYTVLTTMKARRAAWEGWTREKIKELKERRANEEKKDPRIPYIAFLQEKASPKLYWPEFKRKYKREAVMADRNLSDKDREKWYREHISNLKMPQSTLKADLTALLKSQSLSVLNNHSLVSDLPPQILADVRYISLNPQTRDPIIEAYIQTLGPPPQDGATIEVDEAAEKGREARERREKALREREATLDEKKRMAKRDLSVSKARLRQSERELEAAMQVRKRGLHSQLSGGDQGP
jgi:hypothetical protein